MRTRFSNEGLIAKWDYMATHLLDSLLAGAQSGDGDDDDRGNGKNPVFTKQERKQIKETILTAIQSTREKEEKKIETLTKQADAGDITANVELNRKMALSEVIKPEHPKNITEHLRIVNSDIKKVFNRINREPGTSKFSLPTEFALSQNYPNPFNPITKINYDLPKDSKVNLVIYDILGREVKKLVNNELKQAGRYTIEFNGTNLSSGVYFYRIEAEDYVMAKKMMLVK